MPVLALDASTYEGSVAILEADVVLATRTVEMRGVREERLMMAVHEITADLGIGPLDLDAVACGGGPGSFTSLRIAASIAKAIASARGVPLYVAPSTLLIPAAAEPVLDEGDYIAVLDALRGDLYCQDVTVGTEGRIVRAGSIACQDANTVSVRAEREGATLVGLVTGHTPHARGFAGLISSGLAVAEDAGLWEPVYGRKAEAQVRWEAVHGRELDTT